MKQILIVDPNPSGHRAFYLSLIVQAFPQMRISLLIPSDDAAIRDHLIRRKVDTQDFSYFKPTSIIPANVVKQSAEIVLEEGISMVFFAYLDTYLPDLLKRNEGFPCPVSGIWFHPYDLDWQYRWLPPLDKRLKQRGRVHRSLRNMTNKIEFAHLFFLATDSARKLRSVNPKIPSSCLTDPWEKLPSLNKTDARERFKLPSDRSIFLHIGSSEKRKGLSDVISAFEQMASDQDVKMPLLLRVGENSRLSTKDKIRLQGLVEKNLAYYVEGHVSEEDFIEYFSAADWILIPYRSFRYSSGILSNAIGAGKPVIAADHGLIGATVKEHSLGLLFRHKSAKDLEQKIMKAFATPQKKNSTISSKDLSPDHFVKILRDEMF